MESVICGAHFRDEDYVQGDVMEHRLGFRALDRVRLIPGAVPSIQSPGQMSGSARPSAVLHKLGLSRVSVLFFFLILFDASMLYYQDVIQC